VIRFLPEAYAIFRVLLELMERRKKIQQPWEEVIV